MNLGTRNKKKMSILQISKVFNMKEWKWKRNKQISIQEITSILRERNTKFLNVSFHFPQVWYSCWCEYHWVCFPIYRAKGWNMEDFQTIAAPRIFWPLIWWRWSTYEQSNEISNVRTLLSSLGAVRYFTWEQEWKENIFILVLYI